MTATAKIRAPEPQMRLFDHAAFTGGSAAAYDRHGSVHSFRYEDDTWVPLELARSNARLSTVTFRFDRMPAWLKADAKRWAASAWLEQSKSGQYIATTLAILRKHVGDVLPEFGGSSV